MKDSKPNPPPEKPDDSTDDLLADLGADDGTPTPAERERKRLDKVLRLEGDPLD